MPLEIRVAAPDDLPALKALVESAYRGESARGGWTHEADLVTGERIAAEDLAAIIADPDSRLLVACEDMAMRGCVHIAHKGAGLAYLGLLCVDPQYQAGGLGKQLIAAAEHMAGNLFGAQAIEMTVIERRAELLAYYERRGYSASSERRPFPVPVEPPLEMVVLVKALEAAQ